MNLSELKQWAPEIADLAEAVRLAAANHTGSAEFYRSLAAVSGWEGRAAVAARAAMEATARAHDAKAENLEKAAASMENVGQEAEAVATAIRGILDDAAAQPVVHVDESTNVVTPPDTAYMTEEYAARVAAKVADLRDRIADVLADGARLDADLARAIATATGSQPVTKAASSIDDMLSPGSGDKTEPTPAPRDLGGALDQLAGAPVAARPPVPVPLDPTKVEQFKASTRQMLQREGVPPDQIEQRLDAAVAAAKRPLPPPTPAKTEQMPPPGFGDGFADRWFSTEEGVKDLLGQNGVEAFKNSWEGLAKGTGERIVNPIGSAVGDVKDALNSPSAAYYLGERSADAAVTAPGLMFGGEGALARAGIADDMAGAGAIPHELIDHPVPNVEHPAPHSPLPIQHDTPMSADRPVEYHPDAPQAALDLNEAFAHGQPTADLAQQVADMSTHRIGDVDRVVLGKYDGQDGGYIGDARSHGGIYYDTGNDTWNSMKNGLDQSDVNALGWQVNERFLQTQMEFGVERIDYVVDYNRFSSLEDVVRADPKSFSAQEIRYLNEHAADYGYERAGNSWIRSTGGKP